MPDVVTNSTSYLSAVNFLDHADWRLVADWCGDGDGPRPSRAALLDSTSEPGRVMALALLTASGELESYCLRAGLYSPTDLAALTGATKAFRDKVIAGIALWDLANRRNPGAADPKSVPGAILAGDAMEALRVGERIFGLASVRDSAGSEAVAAYVADSLSSTRTVYRAARFFGSRTRE